MTTSRLRKQSLAALIILSLLQPAVSISGAMAATVKVPSFDVVKNKSGKTAITLVMGTKYAGRVASVNDRITVGGKKVSKLVGKVQIGLNGKAVLVTTYPVKNGTFLIVTVSGKTIQSATVKKIPVVSVLPKKSPAYSAELCAKAGQAAYPPKATC